MIYDTNFADVPMRLTFDSGVAVQVGDVVSTGRGEQVTVTGGRAPKSEASSGRVWVRLANGTQTEYYPNVVNAKWLPIK